MENLLNALQNLKPSSAVPIVMIVAMLMAAPKIGHMLLEWAKWKHSIKDKTPASTGATATNQTPIKKTATRRPLWRTYKFWFVIVRATFSALAGLVLYALLSDKSAMTVGDGALLTMLGIVALLHFLPLD